MKPYYLAVALCLMLLLGFSQSIGLAACGAPHSVKSDTTTGMSMSTDKNVIPKDAVDSQKMHKQDVAISQGSLPAYGCVYNSGFVKLGDGLYVLAGDRLLHYDDDLRLLHAVQVPVVHPSYVMGSGAYRMSSISSTNQAACGTDLVPTASVSGSVNPNVTSKSSNMQWDNIIQDNSSDIVTIPGHISSLQCPIFGVSSANLLTLNGHLYLLSGNRLLRFDRNLNLVQTAMLPEGTSIGQRVALGTVDMLSMSSYSEQTARSSYSIIEGGIASRPYVEGETTVRNY